MKAAFTLLELLCAVAVVALLASIAIPATRRATLYASRTKSISNLRQLGVASRLYANEHDQKLPGQTANPLIALPPILGDQPKQDPWPVLFCAYLSPSDPRVFLDPLDRNTAKLSPEEILSTTLNNTGYIYNGFDDLSQEGRPPVEVPLTAISSAVNVVLMSQKAQDSKVFYVDLLLAPLASLLSSLNPAAYDGGSYYLYMDGSVRYLKKEQYSNAIWLVNKDQILPPLFNNAAPRYAQPSTAPGGSALGNF